MLLQYIIPSLQESIRINKELSILELFIRLRTKTKQIEFDVAEPDNLQSLRFAKFYQKYKMLCTFNYLR